ncbi:MAG TPA: site-2 protease family protein [Capillimicrobium sp.]|nr:site-2 protease family protein [Capillimicrobium sp.]
MDQPRHQWLPPVSPTPAPAPEPMPPAPARTPPGWRRLLGPVGVALVFLFTKGKALLLLLPKLKLLSTSATMLVSIGAYSLIWGWRFAVGFVLLLLVHELGHVIQLRREGIPASAPMFIPFLGAVVAAKSLGGNALAEARVGLAGPILGTLGAAVLLPIALATDSELLRALAFTGFFLNLFNLAPVLPLDGGRAMAAMAPWMWFVGFGVLLGATIAFPNPIMILILLLGGMETWRRWKLRRSGDEEQAEYYRVPPRARLAVAAVYVGLIVVLAIGMDVTFLARDFGDA